MSVSPQEIDQPKPAVRKARIICNIFDTEYEVVKLVISEALNWKTSENEDDEWDITWTDNAVSAEKLTKMKTYQKINHFPGMHGICKKNYLAWNLNKMLKNFPKDYNFYPKTWVLPADYADFKANINKKKYFIVKPEASSQGRGIFLIRKLDDLNCSERYLVQEYLADPYLIDGCKFDLRIYVLVSGCNPLRVFIHEDGLTRLATEPYSCPNMQNYSDMCVHLTNYAVNKNNPKFQFNIDPDQDNIGHKRSLKSTYELLKSQGKNVEEIQRKIESIILKTICSVQPSLNHIYKTCQPDDYSNSMCFELLGFDIIFDSSANPILLEVNHSPSFSTDSPLDLKIKHKVIKDTLQILGARVRDRKNYYLAKKTEMQRKVFSCKNTKDTPEEKAEKLFSAIEKRDKWENNHLGGFKRLYPAEDKEIYDNYLKIATQMWYESSAHITKKKVEETPKPAPVIKNPKKINKLPSIPKRNLTFSTSSLQKITASQPSNGYAENEGAEDFEPDIMKKILAIQKNLACNNRELLSFQQLSAILKDKRQASLMRGSEFPNKILKLLKTINDKDFPHGNYIVPKTFDFSSKIVHLPGRIINDNKNTKNTKELNNITI